mmetsp:Transcript_10512/g.29463  ORF Transcript_10512/g.29463 Transcript_10512/m.29463 type:complete len:237 (+) Transcript_10512:257-967(+)
MSHRLSSGGLFVLLVAFLFTVLLDAACLKNKDCPGNKNYCCGGECRPAVCWKNKHCLTNEENDYIVPGTQWTLASPYERCKTFWCKEYSNPCLNHCTERADCNRTLVESCVEIASDEYQCMQVKCIDDEDCKPTDCYGAECSNQGMPHSLCTPESIAPASECRVGKIDGFPGTCCDADRQCVRCCEPGIVGECPWGFSCSNAIHSPCHACSFTEGHMCWDDATLFSVLGANGSLTI